MTTSHHTSLRTTPLRLGILGCANIAKQFARDVHGSKQVAIQAVASRDLAKAQAFADIFTSPVHTAATKPCWQMLR